MASKIKLTPQDYLDIDQLVGRKGSEFYTVVTTKQRGQYVRSFHVFARAPMPKELTEFEGTASKMKIRGSRTDVEGSQITAFRHLYNQLIDRAYNVPIGHIILAACKQEGTGEAAKLVPGEPPFLTRDEAIEQVPTIMKREALRDSMSEHYSESRVDDLVGDDEEVVGKKGED